MEIFIGNNIPYDAAPDELEKLLTLYGRVDRLYLPIDAGGKPRGFAFATMPVADQATRAIAALNGSCLRGRALRVNKADDRTDRRSGDGRIRHTTGRSHVRDTPPSGRHSRVQSRQPVGYRSRGAVWAGAAFAIALVASVLLGFVSPWILGAYALLSVLTFCTYAVDKRAAQRNRWRVSEANLHLLALAGGWPGASLARHRLRHKTIKQPFRAIFVITIILNCAGYGWLFTADGASAQQRLDGFMAEYTSPLG